LLPQRRRRTALPYQDQSGSVKKPCSAYAQIRQMLSAASNGNQKVLPASCRQI
jgi:hypothetical protein